MCLNVIRDRFYSNFNIKIYAISDELELNLWKELGLANNAVF